MISRKLSTGLCALLLSFSTLASLAQTTDQKQQKLVSSEQDIERVVVATNEVLLDAVIRDKKGHLIKDLHANDFEIFEDGTPQKIQSFRLVTRDSSATPTANSANVPSSSGNTSVVSSGLPTTPPSSRLGALALVFDRLSPDARTIARQAALHFIDGGIKPEDYVGVFRIDLSLQATQRFTNNEPLVRQGIERALLHSPSTYVSNSEGIGKLSDQQAALEDQISNNASAAGQNNDTSQAIGAAASEAAFASMTQNILEGFDRLEKNQQGYATTDGLLAIINELGRLPGRKALVFFSEGVVLPSDVMAHYRSVISNANRANVSIYSVDAAGLRSTSADMAAGSAMTKLGQARVRTAGNNRDPFGSMMKDLERNEELMRSNPESGLRDLSTETGGIFVSNTNNPGDKLRQVADDLHSYYLLSYTPQNQHYDGKFRLISLKVNRPGVDVQTRKGYYALNNSYGSPVVSYEAPALALLSGRTLNNAFPSHVGAFSFPAFDNPGLVPIMVEVPGNSVSFLTNDEKKSYGTNFSIVVLVKNEAQRIIQKLSNQYLLSGPIENLETAKRGDILFYKETALGPGRYTITSIVYDALTNRASTDDTVISVPSIDDKDLKLSSIVVVQKAERLPKDQYPTNPLHFDEVLLYPNLGEAVRKSITKDLALFVTVYPTKVISSHLKFSLEIRKEGRLIGGFSNSLPPPDATGRIQYATAIPLEKFEPGEYELKVLVKDEVHQATQSRVIQIRP